ncbi:hypothetical protein J2T02_002660 [Chitinophaga terrae (ex Kim and Jung 2007)]|uniref:right-handed parallel beta-helix repeat-containing protein n=1 Tax=Chitinophaga terrae (ex Kim and Jung 2007) TaxID=408074 RepID=UPI00278861E7|nr:right-handed parallel beta-helix repeat-containing protein [Chitinophaga terrae (ex Kim and Jung 2007)]MDQ0107541.1 hypothetical protein [Chitinophaga terrae (ex Kim and Jung 2007)]
MYKLIISLFVLLASYTNLASQTLFVDPVKGNDSGSGSITDPLLSIVKAVERAGKFTGEQPVTIKLLPGLHILTGQVVLKPFKTKQDNQRFSIEAAIMPDDPNWLPSKMPVIQSISPNNKNWGAFDHCTGFQVERNNTSFRGLKFVGNTNPSVVYYYTIERHFPELKDMEVSQCLFVGNRNSAPIQGALFAQGGGIKVDHCIFYECKNALLLFLSVKGFSLTNSIIYGAYEGAIWFGKYSDFTFNNNVIAGNRCFWVGMKGFTPHYIFSNSLISDNTIFMGLNDNGVIENDTVTVPVTNNVQRSGKVLLQVVETDTVPKTYLHLAAGSAGGDIPAGLFGATGRK